MIDTAKLCRRIAELRRLSGYRQGDIASKLGVTAQAVSKWERGICCPDIAILDDLASELGVSLYCLLGINE